MAQVSLAWVMTKDPVAAPIVGTTNLSHLEDMISECPSSYQILSNASSQSLFMSNLQRKKSTTWKKLTPPGLSWATFSSESMRLNSVVQ